MPVSTNPISDKKESPALGQTSLKIWFTAGADSGAAIYRNFTDPRPMSAINATSPSPEASESLEIFFEASKLIADKQAITIATDLGKVSWLPGRASLPAEALETLLPALVDFAFYESELRRLEGAILPHQSGADADVALAYNMRRSDRSHWDRLYAVMEELYRLRLQFARLEPHLDSPDPLLPPKARWLYRRLSIKARIEDRLLALSDRLEVLEDLYEGTVDRITDHRNYARGSLLEVIIIVLLALEVILLLVHRG